MNLTNLPVIEYSAFKERYPEREFKSGDAGGVKAVREHSAVIVDPKQPRGTRWGYVVDYGWSVKIDHTFQLAPQNAAEYAQLILQAVRWCQENP